MNYLKTFLIPVALVAMIGCGGGNENEFARSFIQPDHFAAVVVNPQRMLNAPGFENVDLKKLEEVAPVDLPFEIKDIQQVVMLLAMDPASPRGEPKPTAVIKFDPKVNAQDALTALMQDSPAEKRDHQGKPYYATRDGGRDIAVMAVDPTTIIVIDEKDLDKALSGSGANTPLAQKLAAVAGDADIVTAMTMNDQLRNMIQQQMGAGGGDIPPMFANIAQLPGKVDSAVASVDFSGKMLARVNVEMTDAESATQLKDLAEMGLNMGKAFLPMAISQLPSDQQADARSLMDTVVNGIEINQDGNRVLATVPNHEKIAEFMQKGIQESMGGARDAAIRSVQKNNLKQIGLALHNYHDTFNRLPPSPLAADSDIEGAKLSWRVHLLPYLEYGYLYEQFKLDEPWDSPHNIKLLDQIPDIYQTSQTDDRTATSILMPAGEGMGFDSAKPVRISSFLDGTSNTVVVVQAGDDKAVPWTKPADLVVDPDNPNASLGHLPSDRFQALFMDGSVSTIPLSVDPETLMRLFQRNDGQPVNRDF